MVIAKEGFLIVLKKWYYKTMDDLTNSQLILLSILVSFVTSMAAAIITTSLLDEAPVQVGQTVNRVVERTIERVVPEESEGETEIVRETIVVSEDDQVVNVIKENENSLVRITNSEGTVVGLGVVIDGKIITDAGLVALEATYDVITSSGTIQAVVVHDGPADRLAVLEPVGEVVLTNTNLSQTNPQLGQTVVALSGISSNAISTGRVLQLVEGNASSTVPTSLISTDIGVVSAGGILLNLSGDVVGIRTSAYAVGDFVPHADIKTVLDVTVGGE